MSECYTMGGNAWQPLLPIEINAQTFTPRETHILDYVDLKFWLQSLTPPQIAISECDASHNPIGPILAYGYIVQPLVFTIGDIRLIRFKLTPPILLTRDTIYSIWIYRALGDTGGLTTCQYDKDFANYPRGHIIWSNDGGHTWTHFPQMDFIFCEFGQPPSTPPVADPPIENFAPTQLCHIPLLDGIRFCLGTSVPCHLTCYWTDKTPGKHHTTRIVRGLNVPWATYFCFVAWHEVEQTEIGDSLYHTFDLTPWPLGERRYFTFRGEVDELQSPSVGPIFEHAPTAYLGPSPKLFPTGAGDSCSHYLDGNGLPCPDHWQTVNNDPPLDDALKLVGNTINKWWGYDLYQITNITTGPIEKVTFHIRCKRTGSYAPPRVFGIHFKTHGTKYTFTYYNKPTTWQTYSRDYTTNPFTGEPWTQQEITDLQIGIALRHTWGVGWTATGHCSQVYVEIHRSIACPIPT